MTNQLPVKSIENLYLVFFLFLPIVFSTSILDPFFLPRFIFTICFLVTILIYILLKGINYSFMTNNLSVKLIICFFISSLISCGHSLVISESHFVLSRQLLMAVFFVTTFSLLSTGIIRQEKIILSAMYFGFIAIAISILAIINKTIDGQHLFRKVDSISGTFANKNLLASILFMGLPFYFIGTSYSKKLRIFSIIAIVLTIFILIIIRTRTVVLALIVFLGLLIIYLIKHPFRFNKTKLKYLFSFLSIALFLIIYFREKTQNWISANTVSKTYFQRLFSSNTLISRTLYWKNSLLMFKENYLFGVGPGNWQIFFPKYGLNDFTRPEILNGIESVQNPHNDFLWILSETGIFGFVFYYAFVFLTLYQSIWLVRESKNPSEKRNFYYLFCGIMGYLIISFFDFPSSRIEHQVLFMTIFSIVNFSYYKQKGINKNTKSKLLLTVLFFTCLGYCLIVTVKRFNSETHILKLFNVKNNLNWDKTLFEATNSKGCFYEIDSNLLPMEWYQGIAYYNKNEFEKSGDLFLKAYLKNPYNLNVINNYASSLEFNNERKKAIIFYKKALDISNDFETARLNLALCYYKEREFEKAFLVIDKCNINTNNLNYKVILKPIITKKADLILKKATNPRANYFIRKKIQEEGGIIELYFFSKNKKITFDQIIEDLSNEKIL